MTPLLKAWTSAVARATVLLVLATFAAPVPAQDAERKNAAVRHPNLLLNAEEIAQDSGRYYSLAVWPFG